MATETLIVQGMHCSGCGILIDEAVEELRGVKSSSTSVRKKLTKVEFDAARVTVDAIVRAIAKLGYAAEPNP